MAISLQALFQQVTAPRRPEGAAQARPKAGTPAPAAATRIAAPVDRLDRRSGPAVTVRLSAEALKYLNGERQDAAPAATAQTARERAAAFEPLSFRPAQSSAGTDSAPADEPARPARPGSRLDISL